MGSICSDTYAHYGHIAGIVGICLHIPWTCSGVQWPVLLPQFERECSTQFRIISNSNKHSFKKKKTWSFLWALLLTKMKRTESGLEMSEHWSTVFWGYAWMSLGIQVLARDLAPLTWTRKTARRMLDLLHSKTWQATSKATALLIFKWYFEQSC